MKTILIATDFSATANHTAIYGYRMAQQLRAKVLLCHVLNVPTEIPQNGIVAWPAEVYDDLIHDSNDELAKLRCRLIAEGDPDGYQAEIFCLQEAGFVTDVLNAAAEANQADIILIGMHGNDAVSTLMMGNHTRKMIDTAVCPLLLVPARVTAKPVKRIAFACDLVEPDKDAGVIGQLINFAKTLDAEVILTHVDQSHDAPGYMLTGKHLLENLIARFNYPKISFTVVKSEKVENGLDWLIRDKGIDMLAMVHREHTFFKQLFEGSFTQKTARQLPVPLLVLKAGNAV